MNLEPGRGVVGRDPELASLAERNHRCVQDPNVTLRPRMPPGSTNPFLDGAPSKTERVREKAEKSPGLVALPNDIEFSGERKRDGMRRPASRAV
jgi:hypothetical protein